VNYIVKRFLITKNNLTTSRSPLIIRNIFSDQLFLFRSKKETEKIILLIF